MSRHAVTHQVNEPAGFYGKVPEAGDFVSRRLPREFIEPWDLWLQQALSRSKEQLGNDWLDIYLISPIWRFALSREVAGPDRWAGVLMPSVDKVGRYFPLTVAHKLPENASVLELARSEQSWFEEAEAFALSALDDNAPGVDGMDTLAMELKLSIQTPNTALATSSGETNSWWLPTQDECGFSAALDMSVPRMLEQMMGVTCVWWTTGSEKVEKGIAVSKGLPSAEQFSAMLAGNWQSFGWTQHAPECQSAEELQAEA